MSQHNDPLAPTTGFRWVSWRTTPGAATAIVPQNTMVEMTVTRPVTKIQATEQDTGIPKVYDNGDPIMDVSVVGKITKSDYHPGYVGEEMQLRARVLSTVRNPHSLFAALVKAQGDLGRTARPGDTLKVAVVGTNGQDGRQARPHFTAKFEAGTPLPEPSADPLGGGTGEDDRPPPF